MKKTFLASAMAALLLLPCLHMALAAAPADEAGGYSLRDGKLYLQDSAVDSEVTVNKIEPELLPPGTPVHYWAVIPPKESDTGGEEIWTALFFSEKGEFIASLPLEGEFSCAEVFPSPSQKQVLLAGGSPMHAEVHFVLYDLETKKSAMSFTSVRGMNPIWVDGYRFVYTLGDVGTDRPFIPGKEFGYLFSVGFYDALSSTLTMLKTANYTHNYSLEGTTDGGGAAIILETWVEKVQDWKSKDESKIKTREITVDFPAAG